MACSESHPVYTHAAVTAASNVASGVRKLTVSYSVPDGVSPIRPGQFFMLKAEPSGTLLCRPISVYHAETVTPDTAAVEFLILKKGTGTGELCTLEAGGAVTLIGPVGNSFPQPERGPVCIVGGGIGVAPVAGFAESLEKETYDFYACFKTGSYGLERISARTLTVTTDDGSRGVKGMLPAVLTVRTLREKNYGAVYACGPEPMLAYVRDICAEADVPCYLSMEARMACGMGACLGCTIATTEGNKRCCADGPVFPGSIVRFPLPQEATRRGSCTDGAEPDLSVTIAGVRFANPVIAASGTFGYGSEYGALADVQSLGGICSKGLTLEGRPGNSGVRLHETPAGVINSIGLENPGIPHFIAHELPQMLALKPVAIANLSGSSIETYVKGAQLLAGTDVPMIELNISCPNVKAGGMAFGLDPCSAADVTAAVRKAAPRTPLIVKLSPNAPDVVAVAHAVRTAGADAISLINTVQAIAIDIEKARPVFANVRAGLSGPAVKPLALRLVYDLVQSMNRLPQRERIPVIGLGGIATWQDAVEFIMAGASAVQVGTATFADPLCMKHIIEGIGNFMRRKGYRSLDELRGAAQTE